jgi:hypothetical protein
VLAALQQHTGIPDELELYQKLGLDKIVWIFPGYKQEKYDPNDSLGMAPRGVPTFRSVCTAGALTDFAEDDQGAESAFGKVVGGRTVMEDEGEGVVMLAGAVHETFAEGFRGGYARGCSQARVRSFWKRATTVFLGASLSGMYTRHAS